MTATDKTAAVLLLLCGLFMNLPAAAETARYVRYDDGDRVSYGLQNDDTVERQVGATMPGDLDLEPGG